MESVVLHVSSLAASSNTVLNNPPKRSLPKWFKSSCWVESVKDFTLDGQRVRCTVLTYAYSTGERMFRLFCLMLGSLMLIPLLFPSFRSLGASTKKIFIKQDPIEISSGIDQNISVNPRVSNNYELQEARIADLAGAFFQLPGAAAEETVIKPEAISDIALTGNSQEITVSAVELSNAGVVGDALAADQDLIDGLDKILQRYEAVIGVDRPTDLTMTVPTGLLIASLLKEAEGVQARLEDHEEAGEMVEATMVLQRKVGLFNDRANVLLKRLGDATACGIEAAGAASL